MGHYDESVALLKYADEYEQQLIDELWEWYVTALDDELRDYLNEQEEEECHC